MLPSALDNHSESLRRLALTILSRFMEGDIEASGWIAVLKLYHGFMPDLSAFLATHELKDDLGGQQACDQDPPSRHAFIPVLEELELEYITFIPNNTQRHGVMSQKSLFDALSTRKGLRDRLRMKRCEAETAGGRLRRVCDLEV